MDAPTDTAPPDPSAPPAAPAAPSSIADGTIRQLDPRKMQVDRIGASIFGAIVSGGHLISIVVVFFLEGAAPALWTAAAWPLVTGLFAWLALKWPQIDYRHWRYRVDDEGIHIWHGVVFRHAVSVPRARVQHIDVSQGPIQRTFGLATLAVYTAGTQYSKVEVPGLDHGVALAVRDALLPRDATAAV